MRRGTVAAAAAVALNFREQLARADLEWAREVLERAIQAPEEHGVLWTPQSVIPWHPSIFVARGLAADLRKGTSEGEAAIQLLALIAHPLEVVSLAAFQEVSGLWSVDPKLAWSALLLAFSLCHVKPDLRANSVAPAIPSFRRRTRRPLLTMRGNFISKAMVGCLSLSRRRHG